MDSEQNVGGRDRLVRAALAVVLSIVALRWLKAGKRGRGLLAGVGALGFGFNATTGYCGVNDSLDIDTTAGSDDTAAFGTDTDSVRTDSSDETTGAEASEPADPVAVESADGDLTCAACGEAIEPGQRRGPDDEGQIVHGGCA